MSSNWNPETAIASGYLYKETHRNRALSREMSALASVGDETGLADRMHEAVVHEIGEGPQTLEKQLATAAVNRVQFGKIAESATRMVGHANRITQGREGRDGARER